MIDETRLEQLLTELAQEIPVPADGAARVVAQLGTGETPVRRVSARHPRLLLAAAVLAVIGAFAVVMHATNGGSGTTREIRVAGSAPASQSANAGGAAGHGGAVGASPGIGPKGAQGATGAVGAASPAGGTGSPGVQGVQGDEGLIGDQGPQGPQGATGPIGLVGPDGNQASTKSSSLASQENAPGQSPTAPIDGALVVKTGSLALQVPPHQLHTTVDGVTNTVVGLGGYVVKQDANYSGADPSGTITLRVPVNRFERAIAQISDIKGVTVLNDKETGQDITKQYVDTQAQITADTTEEQSLLKALSQTSDVNEIYTLRQQIADVQTRINTLKGDNNFLRDEAAYSDLTVSITESLAPGHHLPHPAAHHASTGLSKSWRDATSGFASSFEWFVSRSGAAIILLFAALMLVFGLRYLYPVLRRALL